MLDRRGERVPTEPELAAVSAAIASAPTGRSRDALNAFVPGNASGRGRSRAPSEKPQPTFAGWAEAGVTDLNRHIKLSRIAMANLATVL